MADPTPEQIAEWQRLANAATAGPWREHEDVPRSIVSERDPDTSLLGLDVHDMAVVDKRADAAFIAAAREAVPALIDALLAERTAHAETRRERDAWQAALPAIFGGEVPVPPPTTPDEWTACVRACIGGLGDLHVLTTKRAMAAEDRVRALREALDDDLAGREFAELLDTAAALLRGAGGGPVEDCLRAKAEQVRATLATATPSTPADKETT